MGIGTLIQSDFILWTPAAFAVLAACAILFIWLSLAPARSVPSVQSRIEGYLKRTDLIDLQGMDQPFVRRVIIPVFRRILRILGNVAPKRNSEETQRLLVQAGEPGKLTVLDFFGLRLLCIAAVGLGYFLVMGASQPFAAALRNALLFGALGFFVPLFWLRNKAKRRSREIQRALPDALDMLTIGVEAGLAFESALLRVGEKWDNALSHEFRRLVSEMRVGTPRDVAMERMAERTGVQEIHTFVSVLIMSTQLGVSISQVLHSQADQMRLRRRQRAEELARQAGIKMVVPLVFLIFPAIFVVILGPSVPMIMFWLGRMGG